MVKPTQAVVLTTFRCTAACPECCFECSPSNNQALSYNQITKFINQVADEFGIKRIIWSGGECFLLGEDLKRSIKYAKDRGMLSRCVTNGFWASSEEIAYDKLKELQEVGLEELNLSTGDDHQRFVSQDNILNAVIAAAKLKMRVVISIETRKDAEISRNSFINNPRYQREIEQTKLKELVTILSAVWVSYHKDTVYEYESNSEECIGLKGCDSLYKSICLTPHKTIVGCCGLSIEYIPEMTLGKFGDSLSKMYSMQEQDFLKVWLFVDGPKKILNYVRGWNKDLELPKFIHACQACAYIYQNQKVQDVIQSNYKKCYNDIIERFTAKKTLMESRVL